MKNPKLSKIMKAKMEDPTERERILSRMIEGRKNPEYRARLSKEKKALYNTPEYKEKFRKISKRSNPQRSAKMRTNWRNPSFVYNIMSKRKGRERALEIIEEKFGVSVRRRFE